MKQTSDFYQMKKAKEKITMITAYDYPSAKLAEKAGIDMILVGDSLGMVVLGYDSTVSVTLDDMVHHTKAVRRGAPNTFIVSDMPFITYHLSFDETLKNAAKLIQAGGANAVKVEGAEEVLERIRVLTNAGIPVVAHLGLTPQSVGVLGGYKVQGKTSRDAEKLMRDAKACEENGAIALVLECVPRQLSARIREELSIPVIGIGAGLEVDGQVLVFHDVIGYGVDRLPKFVKQYAQIDINIQNGISQYIEDVKASTFPEERHTFTMNEETLATISLYGGKQS
ncbi:3-methyl-2-oxobutanoate hydroxymethyltransferase [Caldibacillus lycopersici]|uniref:3-methyl-2-oxobutanoate hydroxymethyltransferase n=1 Tax=Perspicuibacillus lycopersici TaxID=1325689 RepID=A0AAE3ISP1_9BACI|nr:3-methyl-2-oxobutanoate hydroxymethyltransferase [Perspicuibacillus lycopersici]MCU9613687.1 3-methyl-2-oxobutanoate hydroxymethyltransferase [Perspicuibacillus lycopersici]